MSKLKVQWRIAGIDNVIVTPDKKVYQLPYESNGKTYIIREIKPKMHEGKLYYRIKNKRYSQERLHALTYEAVEELSFNDPTAENLPFFNPLKK